VQKHFKKIIKLIKNQKLKLKKLRTFNMNKNFFILTDFGLDFAVASMKSLILKNIQNAKIVDIDHDIKKFSIASGAFILESIFKYLPENSIIIAVVDPGVGTERKPIAIKYNNSFLVGPDNGIFNYFINKEIETFEIDANKFSVESVTFHGRDLFIPAAIEIFYDKYLCLKPINKNILKKCDLLNEKKIITFIDSFGNLKTNIKIDKDNICCVKLNLRNCDYLLKFSKTFGLVKKNEVFSYLGSNNTLEIAQNLGNAKEFFKCSVEDEINYNFYLKNNCICNK